ncbi:phosphohistidine phosphatase [Pacificibacter maritimus]|uniref:Phosphohistidine phosphatase n=1 Tax=Pacificibacter maritimus TaxID=762213 RepID=A0A3N4U880_9RHOB|nr:histidine phosphatase family protein [Pacificibacter maritimus]RPE63311.1 phosphohistidine phosphatase [Pacificibacter maritimus]
MALRLILTRHAKSGWADPIQDDKDRTLADRGRADAARLGRWLTDSDIDQAIVSTAARTQETWSVIAQIGAIQAEAQNLDALYLASCDVLLQTLQRATGNCVLLLAHNPGIGELANRLIKFPAPHSDFVHYPTCATAVFDIAAPRWSDVALGENILQNFWTPQS